MAGKSALLFDFNKPDYDTAVKTDKLVVLYFYANWCPICKREQVDTFAAFNELNDPDLIGFRVNFRDSDTDSDEEASAKEFGIEDDVLVSNGIDAGALRDRREEIMERAGTDLVLLVLQ